MSNLNQQRSAWARKAFNEYRRVSGSDEPPETVLEDFLADLMHFCDEEHLDIFDAFGWAERRYNEEVS